MVLLTRSAARKQAAVDGGSESHQTRDAFNDAASANSERGVDGDGVPDKRRDTKAVKASKPNICKGSGSTPQARPKATAPTRRTRRKATNATAARPARQAASKKRGLNADNETPTNDPQVDSAPKETHRRKRRLEPDVDGEDGRNVRRRIGKNPSSVVPFRDATNSSRRVPQGEACHSLDGLAEIASRLLDELAKEREKRDLAAASLLELPTPRVADQSPAAAQDLWDVSIPVATRIEISDARSERRTKRPQSERR